MDSLPDHLVIVEGYSGKGTPDQEFVTSRRRANLVREYLEAHFHLIHSDVGIVPLRDKPPQGAGRETWNGVAQEFTGCELAFQGAGGAGGTERLLFLDIRDVGTELRAIAAKRAGGYSTSTRIREAWSASRGPAAPWPCVPRHRKKFFTLAPTKSSPIGAGGMAREIGVTDLAGLPAERQSLRNLHL